MSEKTLYSRIKEIRRIKSIFTSVSALPFLVLLISLITVAAAYYLSSEQVYFIYDPYTIETSGMGLKDIRKKGIRERVDFTFFETTYSEFDKFYSVFSRRDDGKKRIVLTSHLYSMIKNEETYASFLKNRRVYLFGPLFDYNTDEESGISVSPEFSEKKGLSGIWSGIEKVFFLLPQDVYGKEENTEPEKQLISWLKESFIAVNPEGKTYFQLLDEDIIAQADLPHRSERDLSALSVLCIRSLNSNSGSLIENYRANMMIFDFINIKNLPTPIKPAAPLKTAIAGLLSYDYNLSLQRIIFPVKGAIMSGMVNYHPVFTLRVIGQKK